MLGFGSFAEFPFATVAPDTGVIINVNGNQLNITIGSVGIIAESIVENVDPNILTLGLGTLAITGDANFNVTGNALTLATGNVTITGNALVNPDGSTLSLDTVEPGIITWNDIIPGATMVWTPIKPY